MTSLDARSNHWTRWCTDGYLGCDGSVVADLSSVSAMGDGVHEGYISIQALSLVPPPSYSRLDECMRGTVQVSLWRL